MKRSHTSQKSQLLKVLQPYKEMLLQNTQQSLLQCINTLRKRKNDLLIQFNNILERKNEEQLKLKQIKKKMAKYNVEQEQDQCDPDILKYTTVSLQESQSVIAVNLRLRQRLQELEQTQRINFGNTTIEEIERQIIQTQQKNFTLEQELDSLNLSEKQLQKNLQWHKKQTDSLQQRVQELTNEKSMRQSYEIRRQEELLYQIQQYRKKNGTILEQLLSYHQ